MPAESVHERIVAHLLAKLAAITSGAGDNDPWYTTDAAARVRYFHSDWLEPGFETIWLLRAEDEVPGEVTSGTVRKNAELYVLGARRHRIGGTEPFNQDGPTTETVQNRLIRDLELQVWPDVQLAGLVVNGGRPVENLNITDIDRTITIPGWAVVQARLECIYDSPRDAP